MLKQVAEVVKMQLSTQESCEVVLDAICSDDEGRQVSEQYTITRAQLMELMRPYAERAISMCRRTLDEKRLDIGSVTRLLMVGGQTLSPIMRELVHEQMPIPQAYEIDPLTVVARGAAIFARSQRIPTEKHAAARQDGYQAELVYTPMDSTSEPLIGGKITGPVGQSLAGFSIEFVEAGSQWSSGRISLAASQGFQATLHAVAGRENNFKLLLRDAAGLQHPISPTTISYTIAIMPGQLPLTHSLGIGLVNNKYTVMLEKGTALPAKATRTFYSTHPLVGGQSGTVLRIPVLEGDYRHRADRNHIVGILEVKGSDIAQTVASGCAVEVTIEVDTSRLIRTHAYLPSLKASFVTALSLQYTPVDLRALSHDVDSEIARLRRLREQIALTRYTPAEALAARIDAQGMVTQLKAFYLSAQSGDQEASVACQERLAELQSLLDELESMLRLPMLIVQANQELEVTRQLVSEQGQAQDREYYSPLAQEIFAAITRRDIAVIQQKMADLHRLRIRIRQTQPAYWEQLFSFLEQQLDRMTDSAFAQHLQAQGRDAIIRGDLSVLRQTVLDLIRLMPTGENTIELLDRRLAQETVARALKG